MNFLNAEWVDLILPPKEILLKNLSQNTIWVSQKMVRKQEAELYPELEFNELSHFRNSKYRANTFTH